LEQSLGPLCPAIVAISESVAGVRLADRLHHGGVHAGCIVRRKPARAQSRDFSYRNSPRELTPVRAGDENGLLLIEPCGPLEKTLIHIR
jgi:hypothetical protein